MRRRPALAVVTALALGGAVAGCGDEDDEGERPSASGGQTSTAASGPAVAAAKVTIADFEFAPATVNVRRGGKVTWTNRDTAPHNAENTGEQGPDEFTTKTPIAQGDSDTVTFSEAGTYKYYCVYHRFMEADVIVK